MRSRLVSLAAIMAVAAACNGGKDSPGKGSGGKNGGTQSSPSKAKKIANAMALHGFYLSQADEAPATDASGVDDTGAQQVSDALQEIFTQQGQTQQVTLPSCEQPEAAPVPQQQQAKKEALPLDGSQQQATQGDPSGQGTAKTSAQGDVSVQGQNVATQAPANCVSIQGQNNGGDIASQGQEPLQQGPVGTGGFCEDCIQQFNGQMDSGGKLAVSHFRMTILSRNGDPITNAQVKIIKQANRGKKGYQELDSFAMSIKNTNVVDAWVAPGRSYSIAIAAKGYALMLKELKIASRDAVDVEFPAIVDEGDDSETFGSIADQPQPDIFWQQKPPRPIDGPIAQGPWQWCAQDAIIPQLMQPGQQAQKGLHLADTSAQADQAVTVKVDQLEQILQQSQQVSQSQAQVPDQNLADAYAQMKQFRRDGYKPRSFACGKDNMRIKWWKGPGKEQMTQTIPQQNLPQQFPLGLPDALVGPTIQQAQPSLPQEQQVKPAQASQPTEQVASQQGVEHLMSCDSGGNYGDVAQILVDSKQSLSEWKAKLKTAGAVIGCSSARPKVTLTFKDGSTLDYQVTSDEYWGF